VESLLPQIAKVVWQPPGFGVQQIAAVNTGKKSTLVLQWMRRTPARVCSHLERATGIEPVSKAWEAFVLPLNYARDDYGFYPKWKGLSVGELFSNFSAVGFVSVSPQGNPHIYAEFPLLQLHLGFRTTLDFCREDMTLRSARPLLTSHSHTTTTRHPSFLAAAIFRASLSRFASILFNQKAVLDFGTRRPWSQLCPCQKHPCTNIIV
jgi:hypothetical protein